MNRKQRRQREKELRLYAKEFVKCVGCGNLYRRKELFYDIIDGKPVLSQPLCKVCKENYDSL